MTVETSNNTQGATTVIDLEDIEAYKPEPPPVVPQDTDDSDEEHCSICLQPLSDRTIIPACSHEFCFECLLVWTEQSRRCPLCSGQIGEYLIHDIRSKHDFSKHYLTPLRTSPRPAPAAVRAVALRRQAQRRDLRWGRNERTERERQRKAADELERAIEKRKWIYRHGLYAKHVASNPYTRYKPFPTPAQFASNPDLVSRATIFIRRELRVWDALDVEFLTTFTISLMKSIDIRSESAVKLLAEFLDMDTGERVNAEHFAHELYCYLRSPYRDVARYDAAVQYDTPEDIPAIQYRQRSNRWMEEDGPPSPIISSPGVSRSPSHSRSGRGTRDTHLERKEYTETHKRPRLRSQDPDDRHTLFLDEQRPQTNGNSGQVDIYGDVKGKGRAIDIDHIEPRPLDSVNDRVSDVDGVRTSTPPRSTARDDMMPSTSAVAATGGTEVHAAVQREKPKIRPGWQAMHAHLLDPSRRREVKRTATEHEAEPFVTPAGNASPSVTGFSIRGAAARTIVTESSTPSTSFIEPPPKHVAGDTTQPFEPPQSMSSRDIMARTRAKLEKLKQDSSFPVATTPESGEHDVASLNASSSVINTLPTIVDGNHTVTLPSHAASTSIPSQLSDVLPAQSSHPHSLAHASHETGAADALRLKVLNKLENEKRAHIDGKRIPHHDGDSPMFVAVNGSSVEALASPDNFGDPKQQQTGEEMSLARRQDAEMLEQRLRVQAQLRIKGAAHKQPMPGTASDNTSGQSADLNSQSREEYLRSRLKRMASR